MSTHNNPVGNHGIQMGELVSESTQIFTNIPTSNVPTDKNEDSNRETVINTLFTVLNPDMAQLIVNSVLSDETATPNTTQQTATMKKTTTVEETVEEVVEETDIPGRTRGTTTTTTTVEETVYNCPSCCSSQARILRYREVAISYMEGISFHFKDDSPYKSSVTAIVVCIRIGLLDQLLREIFTFSLDNLV